MKVCKVKVRIEPEDEYWRGQKKRLESVERSFKRGKTPKVRGAELVFSNLAEMARALTPRRLEVLRLVRRHRPSSVSQLAASPAVISRTSWPM